MPWRCLDDPKYTWKTPWQWNGDFNPTSLHKVSKKKGRKKVFERLIFWRFSLLRGVDQTHQVGTAPSQRDFFHPRLGETSLAITFSPHQVILKMSPRSQGKIPLEDLVLVGILHRLFGFFWRFRVEQILKSETLGLGSSAAKNLISFTMRVSKWITMGIYVEFHFLNEDTKTPRNQTSKKKSPGFTPLNRKSPGALQQFQLFIGGSLLRCSNMAASHWEAYQKEDGSHTSENKWLEPQKCPGMENDTVWKSSTNPQFPS